MCFLRLDKDNTNMHSLQYNSQENLPNYVLEQLTQEDIQD